MYPVIRIGPFQLPSYGVMVFLGAVCYVAFLVLVLRRVEKKSADVVKKTLIVSGISFIFMFLGALFFNSLFYSVKSGYLIIGGITWEGGVIVGFSAFLVLTHLLVGRARGREIELFSLVMPGLVLAHGLGRVGCFLGGCCYGYITEGPFGVVFPSGSAAAQAYPNTLTGVGSFPLLPTQLFEVAFEVLLFLVMVLFYKRLRDKNLWIYLVFYGVFRFALEFWRGDDRGATGFFLSPSQLMSILLVAAGVLFVLFQHGLVFRSLSARMCAWRAAADAGAYDTPEMPVERRMAYAELRALYKLKRKGVITAEEYEEKKRELLNLK